MTPPAFTPLGILGSFPLTPPLNLFLAALAPYLLWYLFLAALLDLWFLLLLLGFLGFFFLGLNPSEGISNPPKDPPPAVSYTHLTLPTICSV